ncbi:MAG: hypothetical protein LBL79_00750, partial [Prevotella sp.]|nr:hypothetical protein [Prevotella sp.]
YINTGIEVADAGFTKRYISPVVPSGGDGSKENPYKSVVAPGGTPTYRADILAAGVYRNTFAFPVLTNGDYWCIGQGMTSTVLDVTIQKNSNGSHQLRFKDLTVVKMAFNDYHNFDAYWFYNCTLKNPLIAISTVFPHNANKCIVCFPNNTAQYTDRGQNSYLYTDIVNAINDHALYDNCRVTLDSQARLTAYKDNWAAFNDCNFKIGTEKDWISLAGSTEEELRANFVTRCQAQGFTLPAGTDAWDTNLPMYRWVFATNSAKNGVPLNNSIIHNFEKRKSQTLGYETKRTGIVVSANPAAINSFNPGTPGTVLELADNAMSFPADQDITDRVVASKQSNIMWLGGKMKLTALDIVHNMPTEFGVMTDNTSTIDFTPVASGSIQPDELYIVRSTDKQYAAITYNGAAYNTALANNVQVFKGVTGQAGYAVTSGNPVIYRITDFVQQQTIDMRIVNRLPADIIRSGNLDEYYWYFVEHDTDQYNTTDYVTFRGVNYPARSSFLCDPGDDPAFTVSGNIHLRRCWDKDFNFDTEAIDKEFWRYEQKPKWNKIVIGDTPRCFMTSNSDRENEMKSKDNEYLTTGHPDFYKMENGDGALKIPSFPIQGSYIQFSIEVTTVNPM